MGLMSSFETLPRRSALAPQPPLPLWLKRGRKRLGENQVLPQAPGLPWRGGPRAAIRGYTPPIRGYRLPARGHRLAVPSPHPVILSPQAKDLGHEGPDRLVRDATTEHRPPAVEHGRASRETTAGSRSTAPHRSEVPQPPPTLLLGIDVGGTKIAAGMLDPATGQTRWLRTVPTRPERGPEAVLDEVVALAAALAADLGGVAAIGLGVPELVDPAGRVASAQTLDWRDLPVRERLTAIAPATVEADVRAAALAEATLGAGRGHPVVAYVTVGTGIASTLVLDGRPFPGARGNALVLATGPVTIPCPRCGELVSAVVEEVASGPGIAARWAARTGRAAAGAEAVLAAAEAGDPAANDVLDTAAEVLGSAVGWLVNVVDPHVVVVGGGLGSAPGRFWERLVPAVRRHVWGDATRGLPVIQATLGPDAGWIGAALAAQGAPRTGEGLPPP